MNGTNQSLIKLLQNIFGLTDQVRKLDPKPWLLMKSSQNLSNFLGGLMMDQVVNKQQLEIQKST